MDLTLTTDTLTCAKPGCGAQVPLTEAYYIDGCGQVCRDCFGPLPERMNDLDPPF